MTDGTVDEVTAARVGWVAIEAARLEQSLALLEVVLLRSDRAPFVVFGQGWATTKTGTLTLLRQREEEAADNSDDRFLVPKIRTLIATIEDADRLVAQRAEVIHGVWLSNKSGIGSLLIKRWGKSRFSIWDPGKLAQLSHDLAEKNAEIQESLAWLVPEIANDFQAG